MSTVNQRALVRLLASTALALGPDALAGQSVGSRPASVALTVVVLPRTHAYGAVAVEGDIALTDSTVNTIDFETMVALANRSTSRVEVRLGPTWTAESTLVLVRNRQGEFERLIRDASILAVDAQMSQASERSSLHFRVESSKPLGTSLAIPLEYRLTVGRGDEFSVWTFPSVLRLDSGRGTQPAAHQAVANR